MNKTDNKKYLKDVIDIHIHTNPDIRVRRLDDIELAEEARRVGARAIVIKSHLVPTMDRAWIARKQVPDVEVYGGLVLNPQMGGLNPYAVETAIKMGAKIIWLPTSWSAHERSLQGKNDGVACIEGNKVLPVLVSIFKQLAANDIALATGHLSSKECLIVVEEAKKQGVKKIIIDHPEWTSISMPISTQKELMQFDVFFERCYARHINGAYEKNFQRNLEAMHEIGFESTIIATDGGQVENPMWSEALSEYIAYLVDAGVSQQHIDLMSKHNPAKVLGL